MTGGPALTPPPPPPPPPAAPAPATVRERCPSCGTELAEGQQACVECGFGLARSYRRPPSWKLWAVLGALGALALGVGAGIGVSALVNKHDHRSRTFTTTNAAAPPAAPAPVPVPPAAAPAAPTAPASPGGTPAPAAPTSSLATWPAGTTGYTVVLATTANRAQAVAKARDASARGIKAGVLDSKSYSTLPRGTFVVFAGQYRTSQDARSHADGVAAQGFPGAYPQLVRK